MSAYFVAHFVVKDPAKLATYSQAAAPIIASFDGELLFKGGADGVLTGKDALPGTAVFRFPSQDKLNAFYHSPEYQSLTSAREAGADMVLSAFEAA
ncbi:DUF1330 domain-containing protein [Kiloniella antarctica]|uniref:DUF1330 domain-containing protein n=1 Tax=Kiloniella antarctica TaxID=1550907 RepID=A0ABW5BHY4_9PROT